MKKKDQSPTFLQKLQAKWKLKSLKQVLLVLLVFALTGFTILFIKKPIFDLLGVSMNRGGFWKTVLYFLLVLPLYQLVLLFWGFVLGQFEFFWEKEKQFFRRIFGRKNKE
ncbi:DUF6787 family protein [Belliella kenyensis]|uniref:DUF6787 family protein n=1 Tax=Belliella kenyensis TaxID=1472724 RepID=A0ABV8EIT4_9BACT|nr:DUF6787 family protein [Belliella kenyensis]MCH7401382.1 hypothetical protein [Belliella kenyensis]MDN3602825.1 hypothetical protein [Belliella kenyensis]